MRKTVFAVAALSLASVTATQVSAQGGNQNDSQRTANLVKDCSDQNITEAWSACIIKSSNIPQIPENSVVYYTQANPQALGSTNGSGIVDSNVILDTLLATGNPGNLATGRCTYEFRNASTANGLCQYTDGTGQLAGFEARLVVLPIPGSPNTYTLTGPYRFKNVNDLTAQQN